MNEAKVRLAIRLLSGRLAADLIWREELDLMGYDVRPDDDAVMDWAEGILVQAICDHGHGAERGFLGGPPARLLRFK